MKKRILLGGFLLVMTAVILIGISCKQQEQLITVLNPAISSKMVERIPLAPRADTLEGKTIYLVDMQWGGPQAGYSVFEEMQKWFSKNMPSVKVVLKRSKGGWMGNRREQGSRGRHRNWRLTRLRFGREPICTRY